MFWRSYGLPKIFKYDEERNLPHRHLSNYISRQSAKRIIENMKEFQCFLNSVISFVLQLHHQMQLGN